MDTHSYIPGGFERMPALVGADVPPPRRRPGGALPPPEPVNPPDPARAAARLGHRRGQAPLASGLGPRGPAGDRGPGPRPRELTAWPGSLGPAPQGQGPAPFLAQSIAQEVLTEGLRAQPRASAAGVYRAAADAGVTILGPEASLDISV